MDPARKMLTAYRLEGGLWLELEMFGEAPSARIAPFEEVPLDVTAWWAG